MNGVATPQAPEDVRERAVAHLIGHVECLGHGEASAALLRDCAEHLADAHLLAAPVTVKPMELIALSIAVMQSDSDDDLQVIVDANIGAGRIQIAGSEGQK